MNDYESEFYKKTEMLLEKFSEAITEIKHIPTLSIIAYACFILDWVMDCIEKSERKLAQEIMNKVKKAKPQETIYISTGDQLFNPVFKQALVKELKCLWKRAKRLDVGSCNLK